MQPGQDNMRAIDGVTIIHHNLPGALHTDHDHPDHELVICLSGRMEFSTADTTQTSDRQWMVFVPAGVMHRSVDLARSDTGGERLIILVEPRRLPTSPTSVIRLPTDALVVELGYFALTSQPVHATVAARALVAALSERLTATLSPMSWRASANEDPRLSKALKIMQRNFGSELSIAEVAKQSGLSERTLLRLTQKAYQRRPKEILASIRIEAATRLLAQGASVTHTSLEVGYQSLSHFIRQFKAYTGQLPSQYHSVGRQPFDALSFAPPG